MESLHYIKIIITINITIAAVAGKYFGFIKNNHFNYKQIINIRRFKLHKIIITINITIAVEGWIYQK